MDATRLTPITLSMLDSKYPDILTHINDLNPDIYQDGDAYCCMSGKDPVLGIFGCGKTEVDALEDWEKSYQKAKAKGKI